MELAGSFLAFVDPPEYWPAALPPLKPARATSLGQGGRWVDGFGPERARRGATSSLLSSASQPNKPSCAPLAPFAVRQSCVSSWEQRLLLRRPPIDFSAVCPAASPSPEESQ